MKLPNLLRKVSSVGQSQTAYTTFKRAFRFVRVRWQEITLKGVLCKDEFSPERQQERKPLKEKEASLIMHASSSLFSVGETCRFSTSRKISKGLSCVPSCMRKATYNLPTGRR